MNTPVTSASKTQQKLSQVASAVFVITGDDIVQSGATNIPDLLRMVPGMDVAQIDASTWAISARGLNGRFANELFVMVDGRSVYTEETGGVFWDVVDLPLEDIDRIEVIRGPGGSVWGVNAVNGVINIVTKKAAQTHGGMIVGGGGNVDQASGTIQYGGALDKSTNYRVFTKYFNQNHAPGLNGQDGGDGWHILRGGFRTDSTLSPRDTLTVEGDLYDGREGLPVTMFPSITSSQPQNIDFLFDLDGGSLQSRWDHQSSEKLDTSVQISFDRYKRLDMLRESRNTLDADFQQHFATGGRHDFVWGLGTSATFSDTHGDFFLSESPNDINVQFYNVFIQDQFTIIPYRLYLTGGVKLDHNSYTDFNALPTGRIAWTPNSVNTFWAAISDAVRTPANWDTSVRMNFAVTPGQNGNPVVSTLFGNPNFADEAVTTYEAGCRSEIAKRFSFDLAAYYNSYRNQETTEPIAPFTESTPPPPHLVVPFTYENLIHGEAHGLEVAIDSKVIRRWTLSPGYAFEQIHMHTSSASHDTETAPETDGASPRNTADVRSHLELPNRFSWDVNAYFVGRLSLPPVPSYTRLDTQLRWGLAEHLSLSLVGQNLLRDHHLEYVDSTGVVNSTLVKRGGYMKFEWQF